ncbi:MAG: hypothetical protein AB7F43_07070 [Bacteriovoracia bacterium]
MPRASNNKSPKRNPTEERLRATPFESTNEMGQEETAIRKEVWEQLTRARVIDELLTKPEFSFVLDEWKSGLICFYGEGGGQKGTVYRIFSEGRGMKLELNEAFIKTLGDKDIKFLESSLRAGIEGWGTLYNRFKSLLNNLSGEQPQVSAAFSMTEGRGGKSEKSK